MKDFISLLNKKSMNLIVSIPRNSIELVQAAKEGGADVLKVHMNVLHRASGNYFGTLQENHDFFQEMHQVFNGPTGIVLGDSPEKIEQYDVELLKKIGFQFVSVYADVAPAWLLDNDSIDKAIAITYEYSDKDLQSLNRSNIDIIESSIIHPEKYGKSLTVQDILNYQYIISQVEKPIIIPTQKKIELHDLRALYEMGVNGLMIGAVVTGTTPEEVYNSTKSFKQAILDIRRN